MSQEAMHGPAEAAPVFAALGDPIRLHIVGRLCDDGPQSIARLTDGTALSRQAVTKHLRTLDQAGLVRSKRVGRERLWQLESRRLAETQAYLGQISAQWDAVLARLRILVEQNLP